MRRGAQRKKPRPGEGRGSAGSAGGGGGEPTAAWGNRSTTTLPTGSRKKTRRPEIFRSVSPTAAFEGDYLPSPRSSYTFLRAAGRLGKAALMPIVVLSISGAGQRTAAGATLIVPAKSRTESHRAKSSQRRGQGS